jgi:hypothetical protein
MQHLCFCRQAGNEEKLRDMIIDLVLLPGYEVYVRIYNR